MQDLSLRLEELRAKRERCQNATSCRIETIHIDEIIEDSIKMDVSEISSKDEQDNDDSGDEKFYSLKTFNELLNIYSSLRSNFYSKLNLNKKAEQNWHL